MKTLFLLLCGVAFNTMAEEMTEIRYLDQETEQPLTTSRVLIMGERLRMDYGRDDEDFILFNRRTGMVWLVAHGERRLTGIPEMPPKKVVKTAPWPKAWKFQLERQASGANSLFQARLDGQLCAEFKTAPLLPSEARLLRDFRRALAGNQATSWKGTPASLRQPCTLLLDVSQAGLEYQQGLPLAIRYWDGRSRVYQGHETRPANTALFDLPAGYQRFIIGGSP